MTHIFPNHTRASENSSKHSSTETNLKGWQSLETTLHQAKLRPSPIGIGGAHSNLGKSVSVDGNRALIGGPGIAGFGAVVVMEFDGVEWKEAAIIKPSVRTLRFGESVSLLGDRALIGAYADDDNGSGAGAAYVFDYDGESWVESAKLIASDAAERDQFGRSVSLSNDKLIVGAPVNGSAYIFELNNGIWVETAKLTPSDAPPGAIFGFGDLFGLSVSISKNKVLIGAHRNNSEGAAYVFEYDGSIWNETDKLISSTPSKSSEFGYSVSLLNNRALIGATQYYVGANHSRGAVYIFEYNGNSWIESDKLTSPSEQDTGIFGISDSLSDNRALIGVSGYGSSGSSVVGSAYMFDYNGIDWVETVRLTASDVIEGNSFGGAVDLSGNNLIVGALFDDDQGNESGSAYAFQLNNNSWHEVSKITINEGARYDNFGYSVSLNGDRALVGAIGDEEFGSRSGSAYVFDYDGTKWNQTGKLIPSDGETSDYFGHAVSLSGNRAIVAAPRKEHVKGNASSGFVYVFEYDGLNWHETTKLVVSNSREFGTAVSLHNDRALISSFNSAYIFDYENGAWVETTSLLASDVDAGDKFGISLSLSNDRALVGASWDDDLAFKSGAVFVFNFDGLNWNETAKLTASDGAQKDYFGESISLFGNRAIVAAPNNDHSEEITDSGSAYIFEFDGVSWIEIAKLTPSDYATLNRFGSTVSLSNNRALIGSPGNDAQGLESGSAYIFDFDGVEWKETSKLLPVDGLGQDNFGNSVSLSGYRALIGAFQSNDHGTFSGSAYIFDDLIFRQDFEVHLD